MLAEKTIWDYLERYDSIKTQMWGEFRSGKYPAQPWSVIPKGRLVKIWKDYAKFNFVRDTKGLNEILERMIVNVIRLRLNTELAGHTPSNPRDVFESEFGDDGISDEQLEKFVDWAVDLPNGSWRISDYGLDKLEKHIGAAMEATTDEEKLMHIDLALNVTHQRSDLASWFVEGGSATLDFLANS